MATTKPRLAACLGMIIGGFGPWATFGLGSVAGTHGDGWFVIIPAIIAATLVFRRPERRSTHIVAVLAGLIGAGIAGYDIATIGSSVDGTILAGSVDPGWGVFLAAAASLALTAATIQGARTVRRTEIAPAGPETT